MLGCFETEIPQAAPLECVLCSGSDGLSHRSIGPPAAENDRLYAFPPVLQIGLLPGYHRVCDALGGEADRGNQVAQAPTMFAGDGCGQVVDGSLAGSEDQIQVLGVPGWIDVLESQLSSVKAD